MEVSFLKLIIESKIYVNRNWIINNGFDSTRVIISVALGVQLLFLCFFEFVMGGGEFILKFPSNCVPEYINSTLLKPHNLSFIPSPYLLSFSPHIIR